MRAILVAVATYSFIFWQGFSMARAQDALWIGAWRGKVPSFANTQFGPKRALDITKVAPDGTAEGKWGVAQANNDARIKVSGNTIVIDVPVSNSHIEMTRNGDKLDGTFKLPDGRDFPIQMSRVSQMRFVGPMHANGNTCFASVTNMYVTEAGDDVTGYYDVPYGKFNFWGKMTGNSFATKRNGSNNQLITITGTVRGDEMTAAFASDQGNCRFDGILKKQ